MCVEACVFNLMQIGELTHKSLTEKTKKEISSIPWEQLYGMRNRIVHGYEGVKMKIVWDTIKYDLPDLKEEIEKYLCGQNMSELFTNIYTLLGGIWLK